MAKENLFTIQIPLTREARLTASRLVSRIKILIEVMDFGSVNKKQVI
jgi:hypothetical protein